MSTTMFGIGGLAATQQSGDVIKTMALGSCVSVIIIAPKVRAVGMAHVALPESSIDQKRAQELPGYFADTGVKTLMQELGKLGVNGHGGLIVKLVGGANVMDPNNLFNIGKRNVLAVRKALWKLGLGPRAEDVGGSICRTVWVDATQGHVWIHSPGRGEWQI